MKILEHIADAIISQQVDTGSMQFGFMLGLSTINAIFILKQRLSTHVTLAKDFSISIFSIIIQGLTLDIDKIDSVHLSLVRIPTPLFHDSFPFQKNLLWQFFPITLRVNSSFQRVSFTQNISTLHRDNISTTSADRPLKVPTLRVAIRSLKYCRLRFLV